MKKEKGGIDRVKSLRILLATAMATIIALSLFSATGGLAQTPTPTPTVEDPTEEEIFNDILARLIENVGSMPIKVLLPGPGDDVIDSLTGPVTKEFVCPGCPESLVAKVTVTIRTTRVDWDPTLIKEEKAQDDIGYYCWVHKSKYEKCHDKIITCDNFIMLDPAVTKDDEADPPIGTLVNEGLLYHELLHGQLLINAMDTPAWQTKACNCEFDSEPMDEDHSEIDPAVNSYLDARVAGMADVKVVEVDPKKAKENGEFEIDLGPTDKESVPAIPKIREPSGGSNVKNVHARVEGGRLYITGELVNKGVKGKFLVRIDPEDEWIIGGLENPLVVLPSGVGVGGIVIPVDKFGLLAPYIGLASTIIVATVATAIYVKRVKHSKEKQ